MNSELKNYILYRNKFTFHKYARTNDTKYSEPVMTILPSGDVSLSA